jgi:radical SAM protein with 4Fe4S-binding SPASM domain
MEMMRGLGLGLAVLKSAVPLSTAPYKLILYLTDRCNSKCATCKIWSKEPRQELSASELRDFFRKNRGFRWIDLTGGEVFTRADIKEVLDVILDECHRLALLHIPTNGYLTEKITASVRHAVSRFPGRLSMTVSIDGPPELHNRLRGLKDGWQRAVETCKKLEHLMPKRVIIGYTLSNHNAGSLGEAFNALKKRLPFLTWDRVHLNLAHNSPHYYSNQSDVLVTDRELIRRDIRLLLSNRKGHRSVTNAVEVRFLTLLEEYLQEGSHPLGRCEALNATVTVNPQGRVYPCLFFDKALGSLRNGSFDLQPILLTEEAVRLSKNILRSCPHCWSACEAYPTLLANELFLPYLRE